MSVSVNAHQHYVHECGRMFDHGCRRLHGEYERNENEGTKENEEL